MVLFVEPRRHKTNQRTTHVEALVKIPQDGGSIPPASIAADLREIASRLSLWKYADFSMFGGVFPCGMVSTGGATVLPRGCHKGILFRL